MEKKFPVEIAILDDGVNTFALNQHLNYIKTYVVWNNFVLPKTSEIEITHGTICANFIASLLHRVRIISIKVKDYKKKGHICNLIRALNYCYRRDVDLINISIGSTDSIDQIFLEKSIKQLVEKGTVVVAAVSNSGDATYPANLPGVIAVKHVVNNICTITYQTKSYNIHLKLPTKIRLSGKDIYLKKTNSYYTAETTRIIADFMISNKSKNINEIIEDMVCKYSI